VDLGTVERGKVLKASFTIKNQSSRPVLLSDFAADCGCIDLCRQEPSGPAPLESVLLNPGEELAVSARFEPPGHGDPVFSHRVTFTADPPAAGAPAVLLTGKVQLGTYAEPEAVSWGRLRPYQTAERVVRLVDLRPPPERTPFTLVSDRDCVTVESVEEVARPEELSRADLDCQVYRVKLKLQAGGEGEVRGSVLVRGNDGQTTIHSIPFHAAVLPAVRLVPSSVVFPRRGKEDPFSARVFLSSDSPCEFDLRPAPEGFRLEPAGNFLVVRCDPTALPRPGEHTLAVHATAADGETHRLTLTVLIGAPPPGQP
jgi:hypothetical protein